MVCISSTKRRSEESVLVFLFLHAVINLLLIAGHSCYICPEDIMVRTRVQYWLKHLALKRGPAVQIRNTTIGTTRVEIRGCKLEMEGLIFDIDFYGR